MAKIILQPCSNPAAQIHFRDTVERSISIDSIAPFLTSKELRELQQIYPDNVCPVWGVVPGDGDINVRKWSKISVGDITLFAKHKTIFASGTTTYKLQNKNLALKLWGQAENGQTWEYIYFLAELNPLNIPYEEFNKAVGYQPNNVIQGFNVLKESQSLKFLQYSDLLSETFNPDLTEEDYGDILNDLENLAETEADINSKRRLEQTYLKRLLFGRKTIVKCALCGQDFPIQFLVTSHIKRRSWCNSDERRNSNIVMPACKLGCDELFERGYVSVKDGNIVDLRKKPVTPILTNKLKEIAGRKCTYFNDVTESFFSWHFNFHSSKIS